MSNLLTKEISVNADDGWTLLGISARRQVLLDLFNESDAVVRLHCGANTIAGGDTVASIPVPVGGNYYIEGSAMNYVYLKYTGAAGTSGLVSYVEG